MLKIFLCVTILLKLVVQETDGKNIIFSFSYFYIFILYFFLIAKSFDKYSQFLQELKHSKQNLIPTQTTCITDGECLKGFFCKNNDCIAKRGEGSLCLSGRDEECECGRCVTDERNWNKVCYNDEGCNNDGNFFIK